MQKSFPVLFLQSIFISSWIWTWFLGIAKHILNIVLIGSIQYRSFPLTEVFKNIDIAIKTLYDYTTYYN